jgi:hypothetical protein
MAWSTAVESCWNNGDFPSPVYIAVCGANAPYYSLFRVRTTFWARPSKLFNASYCGPYNREEWTKVANKWKYERNKMCRKEGVGSGNE